MGLTVAKPCVILVNKWYVIKTRPRWEKKVHTSLSLKGIESYCPVNKISRKWSDRIKIVEEPLFKTHLFVKICDNDRKNVRMTAGVLNFVSSDGKPSVIKEKQVETIKDYLNNNVHLELVKAESTHQEVQNNNINTIKHDKLYIASLNCFLVVHPHK